MQQAPDTSQVRKEKLVDEKNKMTKIFKDFDPFASLTETSFTNAAISRCLIGAQIFYLIAYVANFTYE